MEAAQPPVNYSERTPEQQRRDVEAVADFLIRNDQSDKQSSDSDGDDKEVCWICLDGGHEDDGLVGNCKCPRKAHAKCLARWQLQSAGSMEETHCRFCNHQLADWRGSLTPQVKPSKSPLVVTVCSNGQEHDICVDNSQDDGVTDFSEHIRNLFGIQNNVQLKFTFYCTEPTSGDLITLEGAGAYDAAMHCASVSASRKGGKKVPSSTRGPNHTRTASSMAAVGAQDVPRPNRHARSRSMGSSSGRSSSSEAEIPANGLDLLNETQDIEERECSFDVSPMNMSADDIYGQVPLKRRLRALGKRMMRSLRISSPVA